MSPNPEARILQLLLEHLAGVLWTTDTELTFTSSRGAGLAELGLEPDQVVGMTLAEYFQSDDPEFEPVAAHHRALEGETVRWTTTWNGRVFSSCCEPLYDPAGEIQGVLGIALDVTEARRRERELESYHDLVTHDLSNLSMALLGLVDRVLEREAAGGLTAERRRDLLLRARRQAFELSRLAENAKLLVRLREGRMPPRGESLDLGMHLDRARELVRSIHFDRDVEIAVDCPGELRVDWVPFLDNVLLNLMDNAVRHHEGDDAPRVEVEARDADPRIRLEVRGGTPPETEVMEQVLERHVRGGGSEGSGLGLAVVRELVGGAGGSLQIRALSGNGDAGRFQVILDLPKA